MSNIIRKPGALFWILGIVFLLWNGFGGCGMYIMDKMISDAALLESSGQAVLDARHAYPTWAMASYALAVWVGLLASILYLMRKKLAVILFSISFVTAVICFIPNFMNPVVKAGGGDMYWVMPVTVILLGLFEIWWSRKQARQGVLR